MGFQRFRYDLLDLRFPARFYNCARTLSNTHRGQDSTAHARSLCANAVLFQTFYDTDNFPNKTLRSATKLSKFIYLVADPAHRHQANHRTREGIEQEKWACKKRACFSDSTLHAERMPNFARRSEESVSEARIRIGKEPSVTRATPGRACVPIPGCTNLSHPPSAGKLSGRAPCKHSQIPQRDREQCVAPAS